MTRKQPAKPQGENGLYPRWSKRANAYVWDAVATVDGKQRWSRGHATKPDARGARDEMRHKMRTGMIGKAPARLTVGDLVTSYWLPAKEAELTNAKSLTGCRRHAAHIVAGLGSIPLAKLTPNDVERWKRHLTLAYASSTASLYFHRFKEVMKWAVEHELIYRNAAAPVHAMRIVKHEPPEMDLDAVHRLLEAAAASKHGLPVYLALMTGLREEAELFNLTWQQVDFHANVASVSAKTPSGKRAVALGPDVVAKLYEHRQQQMARYRHEGLPPPALVLLDLKGRPWTVQRYWWPWNAIRTAAGLPTLHFHDLRHVRSSLMARAGVHPRVMQDQLGHSRAAFSLETYTHIVGGGGQGRDAAEAVEKLLKGTGFANT